jgi:hypothetical protein
MMMRHDAGCYSGIVGTAIVTKRPTTTEQVQRAAYFADYLESGRRKA